MSILKVKCATCGALLVTQEKPQITQADKDYWAASTQCYGPHPDYTVVFEVS